MIAKGISVEMAESRANVIFSVRIQQEGSGLSLALGKNRSSPVHAQVYRYKYTFPWLTVSGIKILLKDSTTY